ncbi:MAG: hypothetical protein ACYC3B_06705 [Sedimentisphaerales bacterium]
MKDSVNSYNALYCVWLYAAILLMPTVGMGIILHPDGEPNLLTWTDRPASAVVGKWSSNASFVVVSPKWILTVRHQNTNPATVNIDAVTYNCIYNPLWIGGPAGNADIRLVRLKNSDGSDPNLVYAPLYTSTNEVNRDICLGGYGKYRGDTLYLNDEPYGYAWAGTSNNILRWGQNKIDGYTDVNSSPYYSETLFADFDLNGEPYEAAPAKWDSGGGWFINQGGVWKVAALSSNVEKADETRFDDPNTPQKNDPDNFWGIRISSYAAWINEIIAADCNGVLEVEGDLNSDCKVNFFDFAVFANQWLRTDCESGNNYCQGAAFDPDNDVDIVDLAIFAENWLEDKSL